MHRSLILIAVLPIAAVAVLVGLAGVALGLDVLDGWLARRTGTASVLGARFDGEVDAFLILVLSVYVASGLGWWVVLIGAARYVFLVGEWLVAWLRAPLPARRWRKVVTAWQGVVLTVAAAGVLGDGLMRVLLVAALVALAASFGECVLWLWRRRHAGPEGESFPEAEAGRDAAVVRGPVRRGLAVAVTVVAVVFVWAALVVPDQTIVFPVRAFVRLPLEILVVIALGAVLPAVPRRVVAVLAGVLLGVLVFVRVLDVGFITAFARPFDPVSDSAYVGIGIETLRDAIGRASANIAVIAIAALVIALLLIPALALLRVTRTAHEHRAWALGSVAALGWCGWSCAWPGRPRPRRAPRRWSCASCSRCRAGCARTTSSPARSPATASNTPHPTGC